MSFEPISVGKNLFLGACFIWDPRLLLPEMELIFEFGGTIGYSDPYLEFLVRQIKGFRLHAKLQDSAGAVRALIGKGPGYCYMIERGPNSYLLGHVTGLPFCL